jgi:DNA-binding XRE family transcriptional regulator
MCVYRHLGVALRISTFLVDLEPLKTHPNSQDMLLTPNQCRAARGLLDWTQDHLAHVAGISRSTIRGFESGQHALQHGSAEAIMAAFQRAGLRFLDTDPEGGAGVRFAPPCTRTLSRIGR